MLIAMPLLYWPRILEGDTQPWVAIGAAIAFVFYLPVKDEQYSAETRWVWILSIACVATFWFRDPIMDSFFRYSLMMVIFVLLWTVARRGASEEIGTVVRATLVLWFVVGFYQTIAIRLGLPVEFFGRYLESRSGVPSLTAEPSFYGSITVIQIMYLLTENKKSNNKYIVLGVLSVLMSGSILSYLFLVFPLWRLEMKYKIIGMFVLSIVLILGFDFLETGFFKRIQGLDLENIGLDIVQIDASINLRFGHIFFTLYENLFNQLAFFSSANFLVEYDNWAFSSGTFIANRSDSILTIGGELIFRSGIFGLAVVGLLLRAAWNSASTRSDKIEKVAFIVFCLLSPLGLFNPFLLFYIQKRNG